VSAQPSARACVDAISAVDVPAALVQTIDQVIADPQVKARNMIIEQEHPVLGKVTLPNLPYRFSDCDTTPTRPAPLLGQHNREIAVNLGYTATEIDTMAKDGVLHAEAAVKN
jgi:crotonobetainyl-CoA:carnitine CoA-transferase CaiB-like acyl-CoA transferase